MSRKIIAVLEDNADRVAAMKKWLNDRFGMYEHFITDDPRRLLEVLGERAEDVLVVSLDHDLFDSSHGREDATGMDVIHALVRGKPAFPVIVHSSNSIAAEKMVRRLRNKKWNVVSVMPIEDTAWIGRDWFYELRRLINARALQDSAETEEPCQAC